MKQLLLCLLLMMCTTSAWADRPAEVVILPVEMPGYYNPLDSESLTATLQKELKRLAPRADIQVSRAAELTAYSYKAGSEQPPTAEVAAKICRAYGSKYVCWTSVRFKPEFKGAEDTTAGTLALAGAARIWVYSADKGWAIIDQPVSVVRMGDVSDVRNEKASRAVAEQLAQECINDLAYQIVGIARHTSAQASQVNVSGWTPSAPQVTHSENYKAMVKAAKQYQTAKGQNNLVGITESDAAMSSAWAKLNGAERRAINEDYPGITDLMTATPIYNYGGYWPYRY